MRGADRRKVAVGAGEASATSSAARPAPRSAIRTSPPSPHRLTSSPSPAASRVAIALAPGLGVDAGVEDRPCAAPSPQHRRDVLEPGDQRRRRIEAGEQHQAEMRADRQRTKRSTAAPPGLGSPNAMPCSRSINAPNATSSPNTSTSASTGERAKVELTTRNSLMKTPSGGRPAIANTPTTRLQPSQGWLTVRPRMSAIRCVPLTCAIWPTVKKIADLVRLCIVMCSSPAKLASGAAHAEGEDDDAHVLDRGECEQPFDVAPAVQHEGGEDQRHEAERRHQRARRDGARRWRRATA